MKKIIVTPGVIFCIPLFMPKDDWKLKIKLSEEDLKREYVFGRVIETSSSVLVEIFNKMGSAYTRIEDIIKSGVMFPIDLENRIIQKLTANKQLNCLNSD